MQTCMTCAHLDQGQIQLVHVKLVILYSKTVELQVSSTYLYIHAYVRIHIRAYIAGNSDGDKSDIQAVTLHESTPLYIRTLYTNLPPEQQDLRTT